MEIQWLSYRYFVFFGLIKQILTYFPFNPSRLMCQNLGEFFWSCILKDCNSVQKKKGKEIVALLTPSIKSEICYFYAAITSKKCTKSVIHVQGWCSANLKVMLHGTKFATQHSITASLQHCLESLQHCSNIATLCCPKNRHCESPRVTSP